MGKPNTRSCCSEYTSKTLGICLYEAMHGGSYFFSAAIIVVAAE